MSKVGTITGPRWMHTYAQTKASRHRQLKTRPWVGDTADNGHTVSSRKGEGCSSPVDYDCLVIPNLAHTIRDSQARSQPGPLPSASLQQESHGVTVCCTTKQVFRTESCDVRVSLEERLALWEVPLNDLLFY